MSDWLDTETKAMLLAEVPDKLAPPEVAGFSLVLLEMGGDRVRVLRTLPTLGPLLPGVSQRILAGTCPLILCKELSLEAAMLGQFELICCDAVAVFLRDEVCEQGSPAYLASLFGKVRQSVEFQPVTVEVRKVPGTEEGRRFIDQFLGSRDAEAQGLVQGVGVRRQVMQKKGRIMLHWGAKIGAEIGIL